MITAGEYYKVILYTRKSLLKVDGFELLYRLSIYLILFFGVSVDIKSKVKYFSRAFK